MASCCFDNEVPKPELVEATETCIRVKLPAGLVVDGSSPSPQQQHQSQYTLQWKPYGPQTTFSSQIMASTIIVNGIITIGEATDLEPGSTYCLRLLRQDDNKFGPELIVDTEQVGCTPKTNSSCCVVS